MADLENAIARVRSRLEKHGQFRSMNEQSTTTARIEPVRPALGWDVEDADEVVHEYRRKQQGRRGVVHGMRRIIGRFSMVIVLSVVPTVSTGMSTFCDWQLITLQSDCVAEARLANIVESGNGGIVHGQGSLIIEAAAFGASAGDTLEFRWDYDDGVASQTGETGVGHSTGDVPYGRWWNGKAALWFVCEQSDGSYRGQFKGCSTVEIEGFGKEIFRQVSRPVSLPEKYNIDLERDGWKLGALRSYLAPKVEEASVSK